MKKRYINIIENRLAHLPDGSDFFTYFFNRIRFESSKSLKKPKLPYPSSIMLEVTNHCQLQCITCGREYHFGNEMNKGNMPLEKDKKLLDGILVYLDKIGLTGLGEPLLYPYLNKLIDFIREKNKGISLFISTNAQLPKTLEILDKIGNKINTLQISIDGIGETFEKIRKNSDFSLFINNLREIAELSKRKTFSPKLNMVVFKDNYFQMSDVIRLAKEMGIEEVFFNSLNLVANDLDLSYYEFFETEEFKKELKKAVELARELGIYLDCPKFESGKGFNKCPYVWDNFYISWDGFMVPCCAKPFPKEKNFGNVFETKFLECLNHEDFQEFRHKSVQNIIPEFYKRCHYVT